MSGFSAQRILAMIKKEFIQLVRDRPTLAMVVMIPLVQLILFGYAVNTDPKYLPTALISRDNTDITRSIVAGLQNTEYFRITDNISSDAQGRRLLQMGDVNFVITIPDNFTRDLIRGQMPQILLEADASDPTAIAGAIASIQGVGEAVMAKEFTGNLSYLVAAAPFDITVHRLYNPEGFTRYNIVPGLIGIVLTLTGVIMTALALTRELERGTMENLLSMPVRPLEVMIGKILPYILIAYVQSGIIIVAAKMLFGIPILGSIPMLLVALMIFIVCNLALGFTISAVAKNQMQALQMSFMVILPSVMLTGFIFPFKGMPLWAQYIGHGIPMTYFNRIIRGIMLKGSDFTELWPSVWPLLIFMMVMTGIAMKYYRKTMD